MRSYIVVDFAFGIDFDAELVEYANRFNVVATNVTFYGPGGGWPEVRFDGNYAQIENVALAYFGPNGQGETDVAWILSQIHES